MKNTILIFQIIVSVLLIGVILIQVRGTGLGRSFTAAAGSFSRRGLEKLIFRATFVLAGLFVAVTILQFFV